MTLLLNKLMCFIQFQFVSINQYFLYSVNLHLKTMTYLFGEIPVFERCQFSLNYRR